MSQTPKKPTAVSTESAEDQTTKDTEKETKERYQDLQAFAKVLNYVQNYYVEDVDSKKMLQGAIKGMLRELDPHSTYLSAQQFAEFQNETSGSFGGIGVEISSQNGLLTVIAPIEDTPAYIAGIKPGDKIIAIDGKSTKGMSLLEASSMMKGKLGTSIKFTIGRESAEKPIDFKITRAAIKIKSVKETDLGDGFTYIKITSFIENTATDLEALLAAKKDKAKGLILDLRRNPGGLLDQAVRVSDLFLKEGVIVSTMGRDKKNKEIAMATQNGAFTSIPMIVLVNEYSASASEIVAGALQDNKRAVIMGEKTFGKGSVQTIINLGDGAGLKLTIARYYTPNGRSIQAEGISPDVELAEVDPEAFQKAVVKKTDTSREKELSGHLLGDHEKPAEATSWWRSPASVEVPKTKNPKEKLLTEDYQVAQAFNYIKAMNLIQLK